MEKKVILGAFAAASVAFSPLGFSADSDPFRIDKLPAGYQLADTGDKKADGKCGEAKCGSDKKSADEKPADKKKDGACGGEKKPAGSCGAKK